MIVEYHADGPGYQSYAESTQRYSAIDAFYSIGYWTHKSGTHGHKYGVCDMRKCDCDVISVFTSHQCAILKYWRETGIFSTSSAMSHFFVTFIQDASVVQLSLKSPGFNEFHSIQSPEETRKIIKLRGICYKLNAVRGNIWLQNCQIMPRLA